MYIFACTSSGTEMGRVLREPAYSSDQLLAQEGLEPLVNYVHNRPSRVSHSTCVENTCFLYMFLSL